MEVNLTKNNACKAPGCLGHSAFNMTLGGGSHTVAWCEYGHVVMFDREGRKKVVGSFADDYWSN